LFVVSLIFTKQTITKFTNNELMQKIFVAKFCISVKDYNIIAFRNFIIDYMCIIDSVMY